MPRGPRSFRSIQKRIQESRRRTGADNAPAKEWRIIAPDDSDSNHKPEQDKLLLPKD
jgi:hypothetical protein